MASTTLTIKVMTTTMRMTKIMTMTMITATHLGPLYCPMTQRNVIHSLIQVSTTWQVCMVYVISVVIMFFIEKTLPSWCDVVFLIPLDRCA